MTSGFFSSDFLRGLTVRVLFFLSLALFPIGMLAINQTQQIATQNRLTAELSLLAVTELAATAEESILEDALGAAEALASIVPLYKDDTETCTAFLQTYVAENVSYEFVGYIPRDGVMECSSTGEVVDFSEDVGFKEAMANPRPRSRSFESGRVSEKTVTVVAAPVFEEGEVRGLFSISIPHDSFANLPEPMLQRRPLALMIFNDTGEVLITEKGLDQVGQELPSNVALAAFTGDEPKVFEAMNQQGERRIYAVRPIVRDIVFAVSVWPTNTPFLTPPFLTRLSALLPIAMWAASLVVAFWALNRLVITHIGKLGRQMRRFALNRDLPRNTLGPAVPAELREMEDTFISMGESILRDEASLEDSLREKNILLKEVHHRVKNNLQLISSIMNMQIRQARTEDAKRVLERLQERILSLATVHKNLYQNDDLVRVNAATLLREVVQQLLSVGLVPGSGVTVTQDYAEISLESDDAAPLTLLVSESLTNALKHVSQEPGSDAWITITLTQPTERMALLTIANSKEGRPVDAGTGLGFKLINAFSRQLNGNFEVTETAESYALSITFPVGQGAKPTTDF